MFFAHQGWTLDILEQEEIALPINGYLNSKLDIKQKPASTNSASRESTPASSEGDENFEINKFIGPICVALLPKTRRSQTADGHLSDFKHPLRLKDLP